ncbi:hypothetical protein BST61_g6761 [Cercospora zeina]
MDTNGNNKPSNARDREVEEAEYRLVFERERSLDNVEQVDGVWRQPFGPSIEAERLKKQWAEQGLPGPSLEETRRFKSLERAEATVANPRSTFPVAPTRPPAQFQQRSRSPIPGIFPA